MIKEKTMKKYTKEEFKNMPLNEIGIKLCPSGDYSLIKYFGECCSFGKGCSFGKDCSFGERCSFGKGCSFGEWCSFGEYCSFGKGCSFGEWCSFGEYCSFGKGCSFGLFNSFKNPKFKNENSCFFSKAVRSLKEVEEQEKKQ